MLVKGLPSVKALGTQCNIGTIIIAGLISKSLKTAEKFSLLRNISLDIVCIQETHCSTPSLQARFSQLLSSYSTFWTKHCGILIKNKSFSPRNFRTFYDQRAIAVDITWNSLTITILSVYAPTVTKDRQNFFNHLALEKFEFPVIAAGDFNCWLNASFDRKPFLNKLPIGNQELQALLTCQDWMDSVSACQASYLPMTRFNKAGNQVTSASRIDYIYMSSSIHHLLTNFTVTPTSLSDHCIVTCSIQQPTSSIISSWTKILPNTISTSLS